MPMNILIKAILIFLFLLLLGEFIGGIIVCKSIIARPSKRVKKRRRRRRDTMRGTMDQARALLKNSKPPSESFESRSVYLDGGRYRFHARLYEHGEPNHYWAIVVHQYRSSGKWMHDVASRFYDKGINVLVPDLRGHGESDGKYAAMGLH